MPPDGRDDWNNWLGVQGCLTRAVEGRATIAPGVGHGQQLRLRMKSLQPNVDRDQGEQTCLLQVRLGAAKYQPFDHEDRGFRQLLALSLVAAIAAPLNARRPIAWWSDCRIVRTILHLQALPSAKRSSADLVLCTCI